LPTEPKLPGFLTVLGNNVCPQWSRQLARATTSQYERQDRYVVWRTSTRWHSTLLNIMKTTNVCQVC